MALSIYGSLVFIPEWNIAIGNTQKLLKKNHSLKPYEIKWNNDRRKGNRGMVSKCLSRGN